MDKGLTDEEIIKALECCSSSVPMCDECCFNKQCDEGENILPTILEFVNRQKSEIERYKKYYFAHEYDKWEKEIKSEAYKEFAKKLRGKAHWDIVISNYIPENCIDETLQELVGE